MFGLGVAAIAGAGLLAGAVGAGYLYASNSTVRNVISAVVQRDISPDRAFPGKNSVTLVVIGADQDRDDYKRVVGKAQRSDTLMAVRFDFANRQASVVSVPRDTRIRIPGYRGYQKINAAFAHGGADLSKKTLEGLLGITSDHTVVVNFDGFKKIVDLIGGVPVTVDKPLHYDDNWGDLHVHLEPGAHWLNGEQALGYCRIRKVDGDLHRAERQQQFLHALKGRLADPRVWLKASSIIDAARGSIETDLTDTQLLSLGSFLKNLPKESVQTATLPGHEGPSFVTLYPDKVRDVARTLLGVEDAPLEGIGGRGVGRVAWREGRRSRLSDQRSREHTEVSAIERDAWHEDRPSRRERSRRKSRSTERKETPVTSPDPVSSNEIILSETPSSGEPQTESASPVRVREVPSTEYPSESTPGPSGDSVMKGDPPA